MSTDRSSPDASWRGCLRAAAATALGLAAALYGFILAMDPFGRGVGPGRAPTPMMDINQRFMYPQLARSGMFDSAVFGSSTTRLLDPRALDAALGGRFANLAINAGTPWEQLELARLLLRHVPAPRTLVFGLDRTWCDPDADAPSQRVTFRAFPPWLYDERPGNDYPELANFKTLEIAGRVLLHRLGAMPARIRRDGYEVFTPPEASYDLARARTYLRPGVNRPVVAAAPEGGVDPPIPALDWLGALVRDVPAATRVVLLFPPLHVGGQPAAGSREAAGDAACKQRAADLVAGRAAAVLDYRWPSALAREDSNFWDPLHYRLAIAARIVRDVAGAVAGTVPDQDGGARLLSPR